MTKRKYRNRAIRIHEDIFDVDSEKCKKIKRMDQEMEEFNKALALKTTENVESNYSHLKSHHENNIGKEELKSNSLDESDDIIYSNVNGNNEKHQPSKSSSVNSNKSQETLHSTSYNEMSQHQISSTDRKCSKENSKSVNCGSTIEHIEIDDYDDNHTQTSHSINDQVTPSKKVNKIPHMPTSSVFSQNYKVSKPNKYRLDSINDNSKRYHHYEKQSKQKLPSYRRNNNYMNTSNYNEITSNYVHDNYNKLPEFNPEHFTSSDHHYKPSKFSRKEHIDKSSYRDYSRRSKKLNKKYQEPRDYEEYYIKENRNKYDHESNRCNTNKSYKYKSFQIPYQCVSNVSNTQRQNASYQPSSSKHTVQHNSNYQDLYHNSTGIQYNNVSNKTNVFHTSSNLQSTNTSSSNVPIRSKLILPQQSTKKSFIPNYKQCINKKVIHCKLTAKPTPIAMSFEEAIIHSVHYSSISKNRKISLTKPDSNESLNCNENVKESGCDPIITIEDSEVCPISKKLSINKSNDEIQLSKTESQCATIISQNIDQTGTLANNLEINKHSLLKKEHVQKSLVDSNEKCLKIPDTISHQIRDAKEFNISMKKNLLISNMENEQNAKSFFTKTILKNLKKEISKLKISYFDMMKFGDNMKIRDLIWNVINSDLPKTSKSFLFWKEIFVNI